MGQLTKLKEFLFPPNFKEINEANKKYLTHFSFSNIEDSKSINIWKANNIRFFINEAMRHGNCFTLYFDLKLFNLQDLWDKTHFKNVCQWVYLSFTQPQLDKEVEKIRGFKKNKILYLRDTLSFFPHPYIKSKKHIEDAYFETCLRRINSLSSSKYFNEMLELDKENRIKILKCLNQSLFELKSSDLGESSGTVNLQMASGKSGQSQNPNVRVNIEQMNYLKVNLANQTNITNINQKYTASNKENVSANPTEKKDTKQEDPNTLQSKEIRKDVAGPFSKLLIGDPERTKKILQEEFDKLELGFDFFKNKCGRKPGKNQNKDHFNGTCIAIIKFLSDNNLFINDEDPWEVKVSLYLEETQNVIGTKGFINSGYYSDDTFKDTTKKLKSLIIDELKNKIQFP